MICMSNFRILEKWFPLQGELAPLTYVVFSYKAILIRSMLAAGVVDTFVGEAVEGEGRRPGHVCWRRCTRRRRRTEDYWRLLLLLFLLVLLPLRLENLPFPSS